MLKVFTDFSDLPRENTVEKLEETQKKAASSNLLTHGYVVNPEDLLTTKVAKWALRFLSVSALGILPVLDLPNREKSISSPPHNDAVSLGHMHDYVLLTIISHLPVVTGEESFSSSKGLKQAVDSFHALGKVNRNLNRFVKEDYTRGIFVKALLERYGSLGKATKKGALDSGLNLDLRALELGFGLYLKDPNNTFYKVARLDQQIKELAIALSNKSNELFQKGNSLLSVACKFKSFEEGLLPYGSTGCQSGAGNFYIRVNLKGVSIFTPLQSIEIKEVSSTNQTEEPSYLPILAISEALINQLSATLKSPTTADSGKGYYELLRPDLSNHQIRKVKSQELVRMEDMEDVKEAKGSQRVIVPEKGSSFYNIRKIGKWEGYVLEIGHFLYKNKTLPSSIANRIPLCKKA